MASIRILDVCKVAPAAAISPESATQEFTLLLTFLDITWLRFPPAECLFFYKLPEFDSTPSVFHSKILPRLITSLSHTLRHFLALAGRLKWPPHSPKPLVIYVPGDAVSLTIAESNSDLSRFVEDGTRAAAESHPLLPGLVISDDEATLVALQITLFPTQGFCIGISIHHVMLDLRSTSMFFKSWAYVYKHGILINLPPELVPSLDRSTIKDPAGLEQIYLDQWTNVRGVLDLRSKPRSVRILQNLAGVPPSLLRSTFQLPREFINKLRERVVRYYDMKDVEHAKKLYLSTFVLTSAYVLVCLAKARTGNKNTTTNVGGEFCFIFSVDCRSRLEPPVAANYFGNCVAIHDLVVEAGDFMGENGVAVVAEKIGESVKRLKEGLFDGAKERLVRLRNMPAHIPKTGIAGSTHTGFYEIDFGWGRTNKVEITSIDKTRGTSMMENRDGSGVEICVVLLQHEMETFSSSFVQGIKAVQSKL